MENVPIWFQIMGKKEFFKCMTFFPMGRSHFSYTKAKVKISDMNTFFEAMVLKLYTGFLAHIKEYM